MTVPNMDLSDIVLCRLHPRAECFSKGGPVLVLSDDWMRHLGVLILVRSSAACGCCGWRRDLRLSCSKICADQQQERPSNSDAGGHHRALDDRIHAAVAHLKRHGVEGARGPHNAYEGASAGLTWVDSRRLGLQLEMVDGRIRPWLTRERRTSNVGGRRRRERLVAEGSAGQGRRTMRWRVGLPYRADRQSSVQKTLSQFQRRDMWLSL